MGLRGLYGFVNRHPNLFTEYRLRDTKLVIDGLGLLRHLYEKLDSRFGGEYAEYRKRCLLFFDNLQQCDITAYVVFDGAWDLDDKKYKTYLSRHQEKLKTAKAVSEERGWQRMMIPVFALHILQDVARNSKDVFAVTADFEADEEIAALANQFNCPVLAMDNDFFIYPVRKGYIPFERLKWKNIEAQIEKQEGAKRQRSEYLACSIFAAQDDLCRLLGITKEQLPLLATIRGNDYLEMNTLKPFHDHIKLPYGGKALGVLGDWMKKRHGKKTDEILGDVLDIMKLSEEKRKEVETLAKQSMETYSVASECHLPDFVTSKTSQTAASSEKVSTSANPPSEDSSSTSAAPSKKPAEGFKKLALPSEVVKNIRKGQLHSMWVNVFVRGEFIGLKQVENFSQCSSNDLSEDIRSVIYGILLGDKFKTVKEYDREPQSSKASEKDVTVRTELAHYGKLPSLADVGGLPREELTKMLLNSLGQTDSVLEFGEHLQLPMAVTRYWFQKSQCREFIARGLVIGFLLYSDNDTLKSFSEHLKELPYPPEDILHAYAQWQSCLLYANDLNVLLNSPLPKFDAAKLFSGQKNHQLAELVYDRKTFDKLLDDFPSVKSEFLRLWNYVKQV